MEYAYTTSSYKKYSQFAKKHEIGTEKQEILKECGYPDGFRDSEGEWQSIDPLEKESYKDELLGAYESVWVYECYQYRDPSNPHRLTITFDAEGKSKEVTFSIVGGG